MERGHAASSPAQGSTPSPTSNPATAAGVGGGGRTWILRDLLGWTSKDFAKRGIGTPRLDAELLISHALGMDRVRLYMELDRPLNSDELARIRGLVERRRKREPVAYILGYREFFGRRFQVTSDVLVPRPETELLVELVQQRYEKFPDVPLRGLDLCTGSGAVGVTVACVLPQAQMCLTDLSASALEIAKQNATQWISDEGRWSARQGDLFQALEAGDSPFDFVMANPPYVPLEGRKTLAPEITEHEPSMAVFAGDRGLEVIVRLLSEAANHLRPGGELFMEIGVGQWDHVRTLMEAQPLWTKVQVHHDLARIPRIVHATGR